MRAIKSRNGIGKRHGDVGPLVGLVGTSIRGRQLPLKGGECAR
jgi:hypothetical protein